MAEKDNKPKAKPKAEPSAKTTQSSAKRTTKSSAAKPAAAVEKTTTKRTNAEKTATKPAAAKKTTANPSAKTTVKKEEEMKETVITKSQADASSSAAKNKKIIMIVAVATAVLVLLTVILGIALGVKSCKKSGNGGGTEPNPEPDAPILSDDSPLILAQKTVSGDRPVYTESSLLGTSDSADYDSAVTYEYAGTTSVGYYAKQTEVVDRVKPVEEIKDGGLASGYPQYGRTLSSVIGSDAEKVAARRALIAEANSLAATGTWNAGSGGNYLWMDSEGYLYNGTTSSPEPTGRQLYQHTASIGLYGGNVSDSEPRVAKTVTMRSRGYTRGYNVTGLYAPAGEVIKIQLTEEDMNATGGVVVHIGQALYNGKANNIWVAKNQMQRFPVLLNTMTVSKTTSVYDEATGLWTAYVGSFLGGPIYIRNESVTFTAKISGGVNYSHFILGYTTKEEYEANAKSSAPYFDLEVWNYGVLHSGPKSYAAPFSYEDIYKAAVLWEKVSTVTTTGNSQGIVFLYDPFVAAGAAVAFPGQGSVNCPAGWMTASLNYNAIVSSGSWGNFHEYHHNFQGFGVGNGGEVTNNSLTLVSYALFTKISSKRGISSFGAQGLGGWNNYTSATWALEETLKIARPDENPGNGKQGLALYATLLHNFGADNFIRTKAAGGGQSYSAYMNAWQNITHNNMYYYFNDILQGTGISDNADSSYPMFVPVSSVYQTGRSYMYDGEKKYFNTMQPYVIPYGQPFNIDLSPYSAPGGQYAGGSVVIPEGFSYRIKSITAPEHGSISAVDNYNFTYTPDLNDGSARSGQIIATLEIVKDDGSFKVDDVDLVLEFEQSHETNKMTLERTTYTYSADTMYTDAQAAYENGFKGFTDKSTADHTNPTQNCNTDIWYYPDTEANREKYPNAPESYFVHDNTIEVIDGKLYFDEAGKYRIYLRGRLNCALYYSLNGGVTYKTGATIKDTKTPANSHLFRPVDKNTYFDIEVTDNTWVYIKEVLIVQSSPAISYIGVGYSKWTEPMFTMQETYHDADGNTVDSPEAEGYDHTVTHYYDYQGNEVTEEQANNAELIPPSATAQPNYINAYRSTYQFPDNSEFVSEYFYKRTYGYTYSSDRFNGQSAVSAVCPDNYPIENLFDDDPNTACSSTAIVSPSAPWEITVDMGKVIEANRFELTGRLNNGASNQNQTPNSITLLVGETLDDMKEVMSFDNGNVSGVKLMFNFERATFRYYKLVVRKTVQGRFAAIGKIEFINNISGGTLLSPDTQAFAFNGNWDILQTPSTFGHVYAGKTGAKLSFEFNGSRLGFLSSSELGKNFEVYIDGKKADSIALKRDDGASATSYLSETLESGKHSVELRCTGNASIDSVIVFP